MLVALVLLGWPSTARLVRGQILQIRNEGYIGASRLLGARTGYLVFRHMIPNTIGVILVTLTFEVPRVIFTRRSCRSSAWASRRRRRRGAA